MSTFLPIHRGTALRCADEVCTHCMARCICTGARRHMTTCTARWAQHAAKHARLSHRTHNGTSATNELKAARIGHRRYSLYNAHTISINSNAATGGPPILLSKFLTVSAYLCACPVRIGPTPLA